MENLNVHKFAQCIQEYTKYEYQGKVFVVKF